MAPAGDADDASTPTPASPFTLEPVLRECRRDVVALAEWSGGGGGGAAAGGPGMQSPGAAPPRIYVGLDDGTLLVLRRGEEGGEARPGSAGPPQPPSSSAQPPPASPAHPPGAVVSGAAAASLVDVAPPWRVVGAYSHVARKGIRQMQVWRKGMGERERGNGVRWRAHAQAHFFSSIPSLPIPPHFPLRSRPARPSCSS